MNLKKNITSYIVFLTQLEQDTYKVLHVLHNKNAVVLLSVLAKTQKQIMIMFKWSWYNNLYKISKYVP